MRLDGLWASRIALHDTWVILEEIKGRVGMISHVSRDRRTFKTELQIEERD